MNLSSTVSTLVAATMCYWLRFCYTTVATETVADRVHDLVEHCAELDGARRAQAEADELVHAVWSSCALNTEVLEQ